MTFKNSSRYLLLMILMADLSACTLFGPAKTKPIATYNLQEVHAVNNLGGRIPATLLINTPDVSQAFNTTQMAYTLRPFQIYYYGISAWAATPSQMFQPLLLQSLQSQHRFRGVVTAPTLATFDYVLDTRILNFILDWTVCPPAAKLLVSAQITRVKTNRVIGTERIQITEPFDGKTPYDGARAMNHASARALREITRFVDKVIS